MGRDVAALFAVGGGDPREVGLAFGPTQGNVFHQHVKRRLQHPPLLAKIGSAELVANLL